MCNNFVAKITNFILVIVRLKLATRFELVIFSRFFNPYFTPLCFDGREPY